MRKTILFMHISLDQSSAQLGTGKKHNYKSGAVNLVYHTKRA